MQWVRRFILHHDKRRPAEMGADEVRSFLNYLTVQRRVSASTRNQPLSALASLSAHVLGCPLPPFKDLQPARLRPRLPTVLTRDEGSRAGCVV
ncbi:MAG: phage integrase N-terminal SAM-like domain-containing protein [Verrucomicrobia bacterium]|nr:phage integrase N-terminal SAM-like domain-containing protein [Verrucomicrobiota bacterium]